MSEQLIQYGVSEMGDGPMNLGSGLPIEVVQENQRSFLKKKGYANIPIKQVELLQGNRVNNVSRNSPDIVRACDGLVAVESDVILIVTMADCMPVWMFDKNQEMFGIFHVGWQGLTSGILINAVNYFTANRIDPTHLIAVIGPHICAEHFEIQSDIEDKFNLFSDSVIKRDGKIFVSMYEYAKAQLIGMKLKSVRISNTKECTYKLNDKYYSYRREKERPIKAQLAYIVKTDV